MTRSEFMCKAAELEQCMKNINICKDKWFKINEVEKGFFQQMCNQQKMTH